MRITRKQLEARVSLINDILGYNDPQWDTVGAVRIYGAYGATAVHRVVNTSGAIDDLSGLGTMRETDQFLRGMIAGLRAGNNGR